MSSRYQSISVRLKAEALNLLTSTSFFFLVMFFWSFSGWGAALLTGGLEQRVARGTSVDQRRPEPGSSLPAPPPQGTLHLGLFSLPHLHPPPKSF